MHLLLLIGISLIFQSQPHPELKINVKGITDPTGFIMLAIYDSESTFLTKEVVAGERFAVNQKGDLVCPVNLAFGNYAVSIYHDVNRDGELDSNLFKIPTEPTGFSNNPKSFLGPPAYQKVAFSFSMDGQVIEIELN